MWWRGVIGLAALGIGAVWIGQGVGAVHGSFMTGHSQYTGLGVVVAVAGLAMLVWGVIVARRPKGGAGPAAQPGAPGG